MKVVIANPARHFCVVFKPISLPEVDGGGPIRIHERMLCPPKTARRLLLVALTLASVGCSTIYRPVYSPGKTNYKRPPEKKEAVADLLPPEPAPGDPGALNPPLGLPEPGAAPAAPAPGVLDAAPAIPGLPGL